MKPVLKNGIAILSPQGFIDGNNVAALLSIDDVEAILNLKTDMVLVSLKKVIFFNKNGLDSFINLFKKIQKKNNATVGFCDYDTNKYKAIKKFFEDEIYFSLFKTQEIAHLFSSSYKDQNKTILIYSNDNSQRSAIAIELHNNGHNPIVAQSKEEYEKKHSDYEHTIDSTFLGQMGQKIAMRVTGNAIIYTISDFLDVEINENFNMEYHNNSLNVGFRLFIFDAYKVIAMNVHALNFFSKLSSSAAEYNASICFTGMSFIKTPKEFKETLEDSGILFYNELDDILLDKKLLEELGASSAANIKNKRVLNKKNVAELPRFIDAAVSTIEMMTNAKAVKESAEIHNLEIKDKADKIASSIGYYGDIDGMIILVFPRGIAKKACELLIGENTDDSELILDTLAELVNIVGGNIKTLLSNENVSVNITLPRTYKDIDSLLEVVDGRKGVQVNLSFDDNKFLFFLTR
ncbi:MAG: chemotaxis protein CheX [Sulfurimonas sp.]|nr:chemotaxis protein CheX [Sulfurimonas sp.]